MMFTHGIVVRNAVLCQNFAIESCNIKVYIENMDEMLPAACEALTTIGVTV